MNEIRYSKVLVVLCCLALHIATLSAQNDSVRFFNEVDTSFCKVHVGQDVRVGYYSTGEIYDMSVPRWDDCEAELVSGPHSTRSSRTSFVNGKQENLSLHGNYYIVRFKKAGWVTLPSVRKSRKTKSDGREKRKAIFEAKTKCAQKSRLLPPSGQNTSVVQTPFKSCLNDAFLLNFLLKYHLKPIANLAKNRIFT